MWDDWSLYWPTSENDLSFNYTVTAFIGEDAQQHAEGSQVQSQVSPGRTRSVQNLKSWRALANVDNIEQDRPML